MSTSSIHATFPKDGYPPAGGVVIEPAALAAMATDLESFHVERKPSLAPHKSDIEDAICAFANDLSGTGKPGVVLVGVSDKGVATKLPVTDQLLTSLASIRSDGNLLPFPTLHVYKALLGGVDVAVVEVTPSHDPPVRLRGSVRVRVGPRRGVATRSVC